MRRPVTQIHTHSWLDIALYRTEDYGSNRKRGIQVLHHAVCFDEKLSFKVYIRAKINKAYIILGLGIIKQF